MKQNTSLPIIGLWIIVAVLGLELKTVLAENIDPGNDDSQYAYGENVGWFNAEPLDDGGPGVQVGDFKLSGYIWAENIGWVSLSCENTSSCSSVGYGVTNNGFGTLAGYTWAENVGWISFSCENTASCTTVDYGVRIDPNTGKFSGHAWGENIGWISFRSTGPVSYGITTAWVANLDRCEGDFEPDGDVDGSDLAILIDSGGIDIDVFAEDFGRANCP